MTQHIHETARAIGSPHGAILVGSWSFARAQTLKEPMKCKQDQTRHRSAGRRHVFGLAKTETRTLGIIQLMILNRINADPENATARKITDDLSKIFGERIPDAQVFVTLSRLRDRGLVNAVTPENDQATTTQRKDNSIQGKDNSILSGTTALPPNSTARARGRRAATMQLTPSGVSAVKQAALQLRLSSLASKSLEGDCHDQATTNAAEAARLG